MKRSIGQEKKLDLMVENTSFMFAMFCSFHIKKKLMKVLFFRFKARYFEMIEN